jgi:hypothetical protein
MAECRIGKICKPQSEVGRNFVLSCCCSLNERIGPDGTNVARRYYYLRSFTTSEVTPELIAAIVEVHGKNPVFFCVSEKNDERKPDNRKTEWGLGNLHHSYVRTGRQEHQHWLCCVASGQLLGSDAGMQCLVCVCGRRHCNSSRAFPLQASWGRDVFDPAGLAQQRQACVDWVNFASEKIGPLAKCGGYGTLHTDHFDEVCC